MHVCKYLARFGHEVRVLTADALPFDGALDVEIPDAWVVRNDPAKIDHLRSRASG